MCLLTSPEKIVYVYDPSVKMKGILVIDNTALGPGKGGIRMTPRVSVEEVLRHEEIFTLPAEILVPASIPDVINDRNVDRIQAKLVVEAANIPAKYEIERILHEKGVLVVPDIVANAGGVISSYAEYICENPDKMFEMIRERISKNTHLILTSPLKRRCRQEMPPGDAALKIRKKELKKP